MKFSPSSVKRSHTLQGVQRLAVFPGLLILFMLFGFATSAQQNVVVNRSQHYQHLPNRTTPMPIQLVDNVSEMVAPAGGLEVDFTFGMNNLNNWMGGFGRSPRIILDMYVNGTHYWRAASTDNNATSSSNHFVYNGASFVRGGGTFPIGYNPTSQPRNVVVRLPQSVKTLTSLTFVSRSGDDDVAFNVNSIMMESASISTECEVGDICYEVCPNTPIQLNTSAIQGTYEWTPAEYLNDATIQNPTATVSESTAFRVVKTTLGNNIMGNPFSGFSTSLNRYSSGFFGNNVLGENQYVITRDINPYHPDFRSCVRPDGVNYMAVNGSTTANTNVWCKPISVTSGNTYELSFEYTSLNNHRPARLYFVVGGANLGDPLTVTSDYCEWDTYTMNYNAFTTGSVNVCIANQQNAAAGNDFAICNMQARQLNQTVENHKVVVTPKEISVFDSDTTTACIGENNTISLNYTGNGSISWTGPNGFTGSGTNIELNNPTADAAGEYIVSIEETDCIYTDTLFVEVDECGPECSQANGSVHGLVFMDTNANGVLDAGEQGVPNIRVTALDPDGGAIISVVTNESGRYFLENLTGSEARILFDEIPADLTTSVAGSNNGSTYQIVSIPECDANLGLVEKTNVSFNFLGNRVWIDTDGNGIQNIGEEGIAGFRIFLFNASNALVATAVTNNQGIYSLAPTVNLVEGQEYTIVFGNNADYTDGQLTFTSDPLSLTTADAGNDFFDSDAISNTQFNGRPHIVLTYDKDIDPNIFDVGFTADPQLSISGVIFLDCNGNGILDNNESRISGASVQLADGPTVTTDTDGSYSFEVDDYGSYSIIVDPNINGLEPSVKATGTGIVNQLNANNTSDIINFNTGSELVINGGYSDMEGPVLSATPEDVNLTCAGLSVATPDISATDNIDNNVSVDFDTITTFRTDGFIESFSEIWLASDDCGNTTEHRRVISYDNAFQARILNDSVLCDNKHTLEIESINGQAPLEYAWSAPASVSFSNTSAAAPEVEFSGTDPVTVQVIVSDASGCELVLEKTFSFTGGNTVQITGDTSYCSNQTIELVASGGDSYTWQLPDGSTRNGATLSIPNAQSDNDGIYLLEAKIGTCTIERRKQVNVADSSLVSIKDPGVACIGDEVSLSIDGPQADSYAWIGPNGYRSSEAAPVINTADLGAGSYLYQVTLMYGACEIVKRLTLSIQDPGSVTFPTDRTVCAGDNLTLTASGASNFLWTGPNGFVYRGLSLQLNNITEANAGMYYVSIDAEGSCAKKDSFLLSVVSFSTLQTWASEVDCETNEFQLFASIPNADYTWVGPNGFRSNEQNPIVTNMPEEGGSYRLSLRSKGCDVSDVVIVQPPLSGEVSSNVVHENCPGDNGRINVTLSDDITYFKWNDLAANTELNRSGLTAGQYTLTIRTSDCERDFKYNILDLCEPDSEKDTDGDGVPDDIDMDDDNDGISDLEEGEDDTDGDGIIDRLDLDSDNDGISDLVENGNASLDEDQDGMVNEKDANNNGIHDDLENSKIVDTDGDGYPDSQDLDSDNDGIPDIVEEGFGSADTDKDGKVDAPDNDGDGMADAINVQPNTDTDEDGVPNRIDIDSDNDGIIDVVEYLDGSIVINSDPKDANENGFFDALEKLYNDGVEPSNVDGDAAPDYLDLDSDNDGDTDLLEGHDTNNDGNSNTNPTGNDSDGDGLDDAFDDVSGWDSFEGGEQASDYPDLDNPGALPDWREIKIINPDPVEVPDSDGDGIPDVVEGQEDTDGDGIPDYLDLDSDDDGIPDATEANVPDANNDGIKDDEGYQVVSPVDTDGDGVPDYLDIDSDDDGILDLVERVPTDRPYEPTDIDNNDNGIDDGFEDNLDTPIDTDNDGIPDYRDLDTDGDNEIDLIEGHDFDGDGTPETEPTGVDSDQDGLDDAFDMVDGHDPANGGEPVAEDLPDVDDPADDEPDFRSPNENTEEEKDSDGDGIADVDEGDDDTDNDGIPDYLDIDSDNDGILDLYEAGGTDADNDGIADAPLGTDLPDADNDGRPNHLDIDADGDGILDLVEGLPSDSPFLPIGIDNNENGLDDGFEADGFKAPHNTDGEDLPDYLDTNSDNDDRMDVVEGFDANGDNEPERAPVGRDSDNDGLDDGFDDNIGFDPTNGSEPTASDYSDAQNPGGEPDWREPGDAEKEEDSDGDGIPDRVEGSEDSDGDGILDYLDLDSDNDGIPDVIEVGGTDANNDGISDDPDFQVNVPRDSDSDNVYDYLDIDSDNDGIPDLHEKLPTGSTVEPVGTDDNSNGIDDAFEPLENPEDTDGDGTPDYLDLDSDDDGEPDNIEAFDTDGDGTPEIEPAGTDADQDGLDDAYDADETQRNPTNGVLPAEAVYPDENNEGEPDWREPSNDNKPDADGDGIPDEDEGEEDTDDDGIPDKEDLDSDNDGIPDVVEAGGVDADGDGKSDNGIIAEVPLDTDEDGIPNHLDIDADNDGIPDFHEKLPTGADIQPSGEDTNENGIDDVFEPLDSPEDTDEDGIPDFMDLDSDNDGEPDNIEAFDLDGDGTPERLPSGNDVDNDGLDDAYDLDTNQKDPTNGVLPAQVQWPDNDDPGNEPDWRERNSEMEQDTDGDGIPDAIEGEVDTDDDGIPDKEDLDSDNDGIPDVLEAGGVDEDNDGKHDNPDVRIQDTPDADDDGLPNHLDIDADGDGITDLHEKLPTGSEVEPSGQDTNENGIDDAFEPLVSPEDTDGDGTPDYLDLDSDDDGEGDAIEAHDTDGDGTPEVQPAGSDDDFDGLDDAYDTDDTLNDPTNGTLPKDIQWPDNDKQGGEPDWRETSEENDDTDTDGDGIPDEEEGDEDTDGDGIPDKEDLDSDNDGIPDVIEAGGIDEDGDGKSDNGAIVRPIDTDEDGIPNHLDIDADNDGIPDFHEKLPTGSDIEPSGVDANENGIDDVFEPLEAPQDTDGDGTPDYLDTDTDNDGIPDSTEGHDFDGDGTPDTTPSGNDSDNDGLDDAYDDVPDSPDPTNGVLPVDATYPDNDDPGNEPDWRERNSDFDEDTDGDGIPDIVEGEDDTDGDGIPDKEDLDSDNDGIPDVIEGGGTDEDNDGKIDDPLQRLPVVPDTDEDGVPDYLDIDSDNDGITDFHEKLPTGYDINPTGVDADQNGIDDAFEPLGAPEDTDGDDVPDYLDSDSDNDGEPDIIEAFDRDGDGTPETTPSGEDADEDGLDDAFDTDVEARNPTNGVLPNVVQWPDNDKQGGEPDWREGVDDTTEKDEDGDGIPDDEEGDEDTDEDGIPNYKDIDSDNDGILDLYENGGTDDNNDGIADDPASGEVLDDDNDGIPNYLDLDSDNDGILDYIEGLPSDSEFLPIGEDRDSNGLDDGFQANGFPVPEDTDGDERPDFLDVDTDGDGVPDLIEGHDTNGDGDPEVKKSGQDSDNDGLDDAFDNADGADPYNGGQPKASDYPDIVDPGNEPDWRDPVADNDADGDGVPDDEDLDDDNDGIPDTVETEEDTDGDGIPNHLDIDSDNDGILDTEEIGLTDENDNRLVDEFVDANGDGLRDDINFEMLNRVDADGDGIPNFLDIDSDNDGILDVIEANDSDANIEALGTDADLDGLDDRYDNDGPQEYTFPQNTDRATAPEEDEPDYLDADSDNDGFSDISEGYDTDNDGIINLAPLNIDSDGDGYDDAYDRRKGFYPTDDNSRTARTYPDLDNPGGEPDWRDPNEGDNSRMLEDEVTTQKNNPVGIPIMDEEEEDMPVVNIERQPERGSIEYDEMDKSFRYTPEQDACDYVDTFVYTIDRTTYKDSVMVYVKVRCSQIEVYTGVTPNGDGVNDGLKIEGIEEYPGNTVIIFNRYGNEVYSIQNYDNENPWDGTFQGRSLLPDGVYFYVIVLPDEEGTTYSGYIQLMR